MIEAGQKKSQRFSATALRRYAPFLAVVLHSLLVVQVAVIVACDIGNGESAGLWLIFMVIDFPCSLLVFLLPLLPLEWLTTYLQQLLGGAVSEFVIWYVILTPITLALIGGAQYYVVTKWLCRRIWDAQGERGKSNVA